MLRLPLLSATWLALLLLVTLAATTHANAAATITRTEAELIAIRALAVEAKRRANPTGSYTPSTSACPALPSTNSTATYTGFVRSARSHQLNPAESAYISRHQQATQQSWTDWLSSAAPGPSLNDAIVGGVQNYTSDLSRLPRVGLALSGGGYRAMINGAGALMGLDARNGSAQQRGTAGFLQQALYVAGLSGGSWAVGSLAINDWPQAQELKDRTWDLDTNLVVPQDGKVSFYGDLVADVTGKRTSGYPTGIVDYWGRALSYHLVNDTYPDEGQATTFGDIRNTTAFQQATFPFPVVVADEREPGELLIYRNTTVYEFNPFEFGSFDPDVAAFVPIDILGTELINGASSEDNNACLYGFDNFGWVVGTSSTLFNSLFNMLITSDGDSIIQNALEAILGAVSSEENDVSVLPNPFRGYRNDDAQITVSNLEQITLVDGGEDDQNVPINTLLAPERGLDLLLAIDNSGDVTDWPNGTALHETFLRYQQQSQFNYVAMPVIPSPNTFINRGLNTRPTFFGCNNTDQDVINRATAANNSIAAIIAYIPNYPWSAFSNTSTFKLEYSNDEAQQLLDNAVDVVTLGGEGGNWPTCLACASLERGFARSNTPRPDVCTSCLQTYCWDGVTNDTLPAQSYSPPLGVPAFVSSNGQTQTAPPFTGGDGTNAAASNADGESDGVAANAVVRSSVVVAVAAAAVALLL